MIGWLQRLGHRETVLGFLGWSVAAALVVQTSAQVLAAWDAYLQGVALFGGLVMLGCGAVMAHFVRRRGVGVAILFLVVNTLPCAIAGVVVSALAPGSGWTLITAPILIALGGAPGIVAQRHTDGYQNPGSALVGAAVALAVLTVEASLALGAMDARLGQGVVEVYSYLAEYDCLDPQHARLAGAIHSLGSEHNRQRIDNALQSDDPMHARPCKP
jgi:hypothetical protein